MFTQDYKRKFLAKHYHGNKAFIKKFCEEAKLTYRDRTKGVHAKCKFKGVSKKGSNV
jgi:hypothetical protein